MNETMIGKTVYYESATLYAETLGEDVVMHCYLPVNIANTDQLQLMLINDGQDLQKMQFEKILSAWIDSHGTPLLCVGIEAGPNRVEKYGMAHVADYLGRGKMALAYQQFIVNVLVQYIKDTYKVSQFAGIHAMGFSLGALSMLDLATNGWISLQSVGLFSGSFWWRSKDKNDKAYHQDTDRLMHHKLLTQPLTSGTKYFFQCGTLDEAEDRNRNGVIDSIDDTIDLMRVLHKKGLLEGKDFFYYQLEGGRHDIQSWAAAIPVYFNTVLK